MTMPTDEELIRRVIAGLKSKPRQRKSPRWAIAMNAFMLGSTYAAILVERLGFDPNELV